MKGELTIVGDLYAGTQAWLLAIKVACMEQQVLIAVRVVGEAMTKGIQHWDLKVAMCAPRPRSHVHIRHLHLHCWTAEILCLTVMAHLMPSVQSLQVMLANHPDVQTVT